MAEREFDICNLCSNSDQMVCQKSEVKGQRLIKKFSEKSWRNVRGVVEECDRHKAMIIWLAAISLGGGLIFFLRSRQKDPRI